MYLIYITCQITYLNLLYLKYAQTSYTNFVKLSKINLTLLIKYLETCSLLNTINEKQNCVSTRETMATQWT